MNRWSSRFMISLSAVLPIGASAADVAVAGIFGNKAVLVVDGGPPRTLSVGQRTPEGVQLVAIDGETARVIVDGRRESVRLGERVVRRAAVEGNSEIYLDGDSQGHFFVNGQVNNGPIRFLVDTGASVVSIGRSDARRLGIDLTKAEVGSTQTAAGLRKVWRVRLDSVRVGTLVLNDVEASVLENDLPLALLGMSFLSRMEMAREGSRLVLRKRY
ncbi:TIGR02281 family clan AA aspartic protease [Parazoarcus communis]|uniref:TIGR02281 family clan AA aspartic protease n=1 Tax=Parazoarcus communis TaxID=41977 RepID=A0A2U8H8X2_9RHOO|nr:TIGR02281 family clan AA aspartic protease [Parazoarcus communis]